MQNLIVGQYYPSESFIHELDPRTKIISTLIYTVALFFVTGFTGYIPVLAFLSLTIIASGIPVKYILRGLKPLTLIIVLTLGTNIFMTDGHDIIIKVGMAKITWEGIYRSVFIGCRLLLLIIGSIMLTLTTKPIKLADGFEKLLNPFKRIGVRSHEIAFMLKLAIGFIPTLTEELDKIMKAQMARGADFSSGNLFKRCKKMIPLLIPLFVSTFRRAGELAMAMESRCYRGGDNRTKMSGLKMEKEDVIVLLLMLLFFAIVFLQSRGTSLQMMRWI